MHLGILIGLYDELFSKCLYRASVLNSHHLYLVFGRIGSDPKFGPSPAMLVEVIVVCLSLPMHMPV
jgi:hypothetical protein